MKYYIYGLYSSEDGVIRYIGKTKNNISARLNEHKCDALTKGFKNHKCNWIRKVYNSGYEVKILLIEETDEKKWQEREIFWIKKYRNKTSLVNELDGGESGGPGGKVFPLSYKDVKKIIQENNLKFSTYDEYKKFLKNNSCFLNVLPKCPKKIFSKRKEWVSWGDFFGNDYISDKEKFENYFSYEEAKKYLISNNIKDRKTYKLFAKNEKKLPPVPWKTYCNNGWINSYDFFSNKKKNFCSYDVFKRYVKIVFKTAISMTKYENAYHSNKYSKRLPAHPERYFHKKWSEIINEIFY